jgi:hypothetical protein
MLKAGRVHCYSLRRWKSEVLLCGRLKERLDGLFEDVFRLWTCLMFDLYRGAVDFEVMIVTNWETSHE